MGLRVLVCGGRDFGEVPRGCPDSAKPDAARRALNEWRLLRDTLDTLKVDRGISVVIHGAARGADRRAGTWARNNLIREEPYEADWNEHGRAAGPIRNAQMLRDGKPDLVVAFPGGNGTADMVRQARAAGVEVIEVPRVRA